MNPSIRKLSKLIIISLLLPACNSKVEKQDQDTFVSNQFQYMPAISQEVAKETRPAKIFLKKINKIFSIVLKNFKGSQVNIDDKTKIFIEENKVSAIFSGIDNIKNGKLVIDGDKFSITYKANTETIKLDINKNKNISWDIVIQGKYIDSKVESFRLQFKQEAKTYTIFNKNFQESKFYLRELMKFIANNVDSKIKVDDDSIDINLEKYGLDIILNHETGIATLSKPFVAESREIPLFSKKFGLKLNELLVTIDKKGKINVEAIDLRVVEKSDKPLMIEITKEGITATKDKLDGNILKFNQAW